MNVDRLELAHLRLISSAYEMAGFIDALLNVRALPACHREQAQSLVDEFSAHARERKAAIDEPSPLSLDRPLHVGAGALSGLAAAIATPTEVA